MTTETPPKSFRDALQVVNAFYGFDREGDPDRYSLSNDFLQDSYRLIVFNLHLSIEELLKALIYERLPVTRTFHAREQIQSLERMRSRDVIDWAARVKIIKKKTYEDLLELNRIRNACAHNWQLHSYRVVKHQQVRRRRYKIEFRGRNLLNLDTLKDEFLPVYGNIYLRLFGSHYLGRPAIV